MKIRLNHRIYIEKFIALYTMMVSDISSPNTMHYNSSPNTSIYLMANRWFYWAPYVLYGFYRWASGCFDILKRCIWEIGNGGDDGKDMNQITFRKFFEANISQRHSLASFDFIWKTSLYRWLTVTKISLHLYFTCHIVFFVSLALSLPLWLYALF